VTRRPWTAEEIHLLRSKYPIHGVGVVTGMLPGRTCDGVKAKAHALGLRVTDVQGWVGIGTIAHLTGLHPTSVRARALASGYARRIGGTNRRQFVMVPEAWAEAYVKMALRGQQAEELMGHHYTLEKTAKLFGVYRTTIKRWLFGIPASSPGVAHLARIQVVTTSGRGRRQYLFNPWHVEREARAYREANRAR
jgi:hypothetical protein